MRLYSSRDLQHEADSVLYKKKRSFKEEKDSSVMQLEQASKELLGSVHIHSLIEK